MLAPVLHALVSPLADVIAATDSQPMHFTTFAKRLFADLSSESQGLYSFYLKKVDGFVALHSLSGGEQPHGMQHRAGRERGTIRI